ncbi:hypothetical protein GCM10025868_25800 [Angustibacter aerolatus]|uniref:Uncharacterized protein n=1 Tax=Angustibacter aerolatus TaxID=1162965 RepID=A0ABQ6JGM1_9ACTN|nr:hypothetical protein [Angustibacter aerolatus]GMA87330.1 hypothetical protein GCM10025868_25800 [Angustibacter aerolatus]
MLVCTGTGATGWAASIVRERSAEVVLPAPSDPTAAWFVREAWPSPATGTSRTLGLLQPAERLVLSVESDALVVFGDGLETDRLTVGYGERVRVGTSPRTLRLVG